MQAIFIYCAFGREAKYVMVLMSKIVITKIVKFIAPNVAL